MIASSGPGRPDARSPRTWRGRCVFRHTTAPGGGAVSKEVAPMIASTSSVNPSTTHPLHAAFLDLLPKLQTHAAIYFRHVRCPDTRADCVAECEALAWKWYVRLHEQGKDVNQFLMAFIFLVARAVKSGRRACGMDPADDVMSPVAQRRHDFTVAALPTSTRHSFEVLYSQVKGQQDIDAYEERLRDNMLSRRRPTQ